MGFQSINEIEQFSFEDCQITKFTINDSELIFELESLIVRPNNTQNTNYTESYAGTTTLRLTNACIISAIKDGFKYYDANDVLINEVCDQTLSEAQIKELPSMCEGAYLYTIEKQKEENNLLYCNIGIELPGEDIYDNINPDSYTLEVSFERSIFNWQVYLNKVQR